LNQLSKVEPLKDLERFSLVPIDEFGVICWPNGAGLAQHALYGRLQGRVGTAS
jgi:hypothetical protein